MPATIKPTFKPLSTPDTCLLTLPSSIFTPKTSQQCLSIPTKPIKLRLLLTLPSLPFPIKPKTQFPFLTAFVSQTSNWAQEEEDEEEEKSNTITLTDLEQEELEGPSWESQGVGETQARVSNWEPEGEDAPTEDGKGGSFEEEEEEEVEGGEVGFMEPLEEAKVFVGNLPYEVDSQSLAMLFEKAGTVEIAEVIYNRETDTSRGFGFVTMSTVEESEKAVDMFHRYDLEGRLLTVNKAAPRGSRPERPPRVNEAGYRIYVGNLPWDVDNGRLEQVFSEHGKVVNARVVFDRDTGRSRGFGFVTMSSETEMNDAIAALDGQSLEGRAIRVNIAEEKPRRNF